ncbi:MAG TPA: hypothetical protein VKP61_02865 [Candidatus Acidoferrum sp.]|nr:hypothetical protein [Candidatus Acidoferrum sp.]
MPPSKAMETPAGFASANGDAGARAVEFLRYGMLEPFASDKNQG